MTKSSADTETVTSANDGKPTSSHTGKEPEPHSTLATHNRKELVSGAPPPARVRMGTREYIMSAVIGAISTVVTVVMMFLGFRLCEALWG
ncbi:hypothetical protein PG984_014523 [Apiospora sp. TS-2023a]